jgi:isopentenyl diphosphate isomerase/L-lactate dehydrogenase-like FMN-dependent dehydrogenase
VLRRADGSPRTGRAFSLAELEELRRGVDGHLAVKGVMDPADARRIVDAGADTVIVSNHGGRLLDRAPATLEVLPAVVSEVGGQVDVLVDGGVRSAADVAVAVALGARAALIGRPVCWAVVDGREGVAALFAMFLADFQRVLAATGCPAVADLGPEVLRPASFSRLDAAVTNDSKERLLDPS